MLKTQLRCCLQDKSAGNYFYIARKGHRLTDIDYTAPPDAWPPSTLYLQDSAWAYTFIIIVKAKLFKAICKAIKYGGRFSQLYLACILGSSI